MFRARARGEYPTQTYIETRGSNGARSTRHRLTTTQHAVSYAGPKYWRSLPPHLRSINSLIRFRKSLKEHLLSQYDEN